MIVGGVQVINAGLPLIVEGVPAPDVTQLDWRPPAFSDLAAARAMVALDDETTAAANAAAIAAVHAVRPRVVGIRPARAVVDALPGPARTMLHAGPPIEFSRMCGPMRGALARRGPLRGLGRDPADAERALAAGEIAVEPCHHHGAVGPMAGAVSPSMPVWQVVDDPRPAPRHAFATLNEGLGTVLRFGAYGPEVIDRLRWMAEVLGPVLDTAVQPSEPIDVTTMIGQALAMGDEGHNRSVAASALLARGSRRRSPRRRRVEVLRFLPATTTSRSTSRWPRPSCVMDAAAHVPGSSLVTVMSRNGVEFGIRVAGTGDRWYTAPVGPADGLFFPGLRTRRRQPRHGRLGDHRDAGHRRFRDGGLAVDHHLRRRHAGRRAGREPRDAPRSRSRRTRRFRCRRSTSSAARPGIDVLKVARHLRAAADQHRDRAPGRGRRPDRRRDRRPPRPRCSSRRCTASPRPAGRTT